MEFDRNTVPLHRQVLMKGLKSNGSSTSCINNEPNVPVPVPVKSYLCSSLSRHHKYMDMILKLWNKDPEPEELFNLKNWIKWIRQVAQRLNETERFSDKNILKSYADALLDMLCDERYKYLQKASANLDNDQLSRLFQLKKLYDEKEDLKLACMANDTKSCKWTEDDDVEDVNGIFETSQTSLPSTDCIVTYEARHFPLKPSNVNPTSPKCRRYSSNSPPRIFSTPSKGSTPCSSKANFYPDALSRKRNQSTSACRPPENDERKRRRSSGSANRPFNQLKIQFCPRKPKHLPECKNEQVYSSSKQNETSGVCYQDENVGESKCIEEENHDVYEFESSLNGIDDLVIENPTPPCSPPCTSLAVETTEVFGRSSVSDSFRSVPGSNVVANCAGQRRDSCSSNVQNKSIPSEPKSCENRKLKGIKIRASSKEPLTQTTGTHTQTHTTQPASIKTFEDDFELPDIEAPNIDQDKENYPVSVDEIADKYPKPLSAPALTLEIFEELKGALDKPPKEKIITGFSLYILQEDLAVYNKDTEWLNDRNIDFYLELIKERSNRSGFPKVYIFHSFFYTLLTDKDGGYEVVQETTGEDDIFKYDIVFFPVNLNQHWRLVVVKFQEKSLKCYDSMKHDNADVLKSIGRYLKKEYNRKHGRTSSGIDILNDCVSEDGRMSPIISTTDEPVKTRTYFDSNNWTVENVSSETIPQQKNAIDCGIFVLQYAEYLSREKDFDFDQSHISYFRKRMMYETLTKQLLTSAGNENVGKL